MSMSLIKIYRTPTTTNERLPTEQQNGYHGVATEQFIEGDCVGGNQKLCTVHAMIQTNLLVCAMVHLANLLLSRNMHVMYLILEQYLIQL